MRETIKNRRATFANNLLQVFMTKETQTDWADVISMRWSDFEDFVKKYDSSVNPQNYGKRMMLWAVCNSVGFQYRTGVIDLDSIFANGGSLMLLTWWKFKPVIQKYRGSMWSKDALSDFEYLADALEIRMNSSDAEYVKLMKTVLSDSASSVEGRTMTFFNINP
jgi:hypothetical protein